MDKLDRELLNLTQREFPITSRPFLAISEDLGISEDDVLDRVRQLLASGIIKRIGPSFDAQSIGHVSTLVAANVPSERLVEIAGIISSFPEVTHNYQRDMMYNLWFTLVARDSVVLEHTIDSIKEQTGIENLYLLPAERVFKIQVNFEF
jgi:DNA-binding Lrp family transcriptional regulator